MPHAERPETAEACATVLRECSEGRRTVRVRGGGTKDHLGPLHETDVVLETAGLAGIIDHVPEDLTATVGAGTTVAALREALAAHGQFLPIDARSPSVSSIQSTRSSRSTKRSTK